MKGYFRFVFFCIFSVFAVPCSGPAKDLQFADILNQALANSYDLRIGRLDVEISELRLAEAGAMYLPVLSLRLGNEYLHDLSKDAAGTVSVGDMIISGNESTHQNFVTLFAEYLLYDFGARSRKYRNARSNVALAEHTAAQRRIDFKIEVLSLYGTGLELQKKIETWAVLLRHRQEIYRYTRRLVEAGNRGRLEQGHAAVAVAEALQICENLRLEMTEILGNITCYTGESYRLAEVRFSDFPDQPWNDVVADVLNLPEIKAYDVAIEQKKTEYEIALRQWLPTLTLYSAYQMYGSDQENLSRSLGNLVERNATIGVMLNMNIFNGFSDQAETARLLKEMRRLQVEKAKKVAEYEQRTRTLLQKNILSGQTLKNRHDFRATLEEQDHMDGRLAERQIIDGISRLRQQEELQQQLLTLELDAVARCMNVLHLQILAGGNI